MVGKLSSVFSFRNTSEDGKTYRHGSLGRSEACLHAQNERSVYQSGFRMKAYIHAVSFCYRILTLLLLKQDILLLRAEMDIVSL